MRISRPSPLIAIVLYLCCVTAVTELLGHARKESSAERTFEGMITDTRSGAKHRPSIAKNAAECVRVCVHGGAHFALVDGEHTYQLDGDTAILKGIVGQRGKIFGSLNGNTITVASIASNE